MPDIENFDETNRIRFKQFILKGEFFFVGGWHTYDIPASITVKNNAFVEYIAMIKGKLTHTPTDVVKDIQGDFSIGKKYIDDQNQIDINGETKCFANISRNGRNRTIYNEVIKLIKDFRFTSPGRYIDATKLNPSLYNDLRETPVELVPIFANNKGKPVISKFILNILF